MNLNTQGDTVILRYRDILILLTLVAIWVVMLVEHWPTAPGRVIVGTLIGVVIGLWGVWSGLMRRVLDWLAGLRGWRNVE